MVLRNSPKTAKAPEATGKPVERPSRNAATMVAEGIPNCTSGHLCGSEDPLIQLDGGSDSFTQNVVACFASVLALQSPFQPVYADNKGINSHRCDMEYIKVINGLDSVPDLYQGPESNYDNELGYSFSCVTPRAREVFPMCLKSSPAEGLIFIPMVYYKEFIRLCDAEELVIWPEY